jgi:hypothetical protein
MSWSVELKNDEGNGSCRSCHNIEGCQIAKVSDVVGYLLNSVADSCDGNHITGCAELKCNSYVGTEKSDPPAGESATPGTDGE